MPKTLLLADDSVVIQKLVGLSFANEDIELVTTDNGDEALTRAREIIPDLVLADVVMPGKNGYEVCAAIKGDPQLAHVPVLLLTGTFEAFDEERARQVGSDGHITKPFEAQGLVDRVTELLVRAAQASPAAVPAAPPPPAASAPPQAPPSAAAGPAPAAPFAAAAPTASSDDAFDFFDDSVQQLAAEEPTLVDASPAGVSAPGPATAGADPPSSLADDPLAIDGLGESGILDDSFGLEPSGPDDLTRAVTSPPPAPAAAPPIPDDLGATRIAFDEDPLAGDPASAAAGAESPAAPAANASPWQGETVATPTPAADPMLADDLFAEPSAPPSAPPPRPEPALPDIPVTTSDSPPTAPRVDVAASPAPPVPGPDPLEAAAAEMRQDANADGSPAAPAASEKSDFDVSISDLGSDLGDPFASSSSAEANAASSTASRAASLDASPEMRDRIHETLEKVAWEAFADLSDTIVRQVIQRVESVIWEIVPQMAETLIQEEIRRIKG